MNHSYLTVEKGGELSLTLTPDGHLMMIVARNRLLLSYFQHGGWSAERLDLFALLAQHIDGKRWALVNAEQVGGVSNAKLLIAKEPTFVSSGNGADIIGTCGGLWELPEDQRWVLYDMMTAEVSYFPRAHVWTAEA